MRKHLISLSTAAALSIFCPLANAGSLTLDPDQPSFTPSGVFFNNDMTAQIIGGSLVQILGATDINITPNSSATIGVSGTFSADAGDFFSLLYNFSIDLESSLPVHVTLQGTAGGFSISDSFMLQQGVHDYSGMKESMPTPFAFSGTYQGTITFDFGSETLASIDGTSDVLTIKIPKDGLDFQLEPTVIPEPSVYALFGLGLGGLLLASLRRRLA